MCLQNLPAPSFLVSFLDKTIYFSVYIWRIRFCYKIPIFNQTEINKSFEDKKQGNTDIIKLYYKETSER